MKYTKKLLFCKYLNIHSIATSNKYVKYFMYLLRIFSLFIYTTFVTVMIPSTILIDNYRALRYIYIKNKFRML